LDIRDANGVGDRKKNLGVVGGVFHLNLDPHGKRNPRKERGEGK